MIEPNELAERWANVERVLDAMPEHERRQHWDMSTWGRVTDCGTVACAAGQCGLDPWFRARGFQLNFVDGEGEISDVEPFFGLEGASRIFFDATPRPVETVLEEVRTYLSELRKIAALMARVTAPPVGELWTEQGGIYCGACVGADGQPDYLIVVGPEYDGHLDWRAANAWASNIDIAGHRDFTLPSRLEQRRLFDRARELFQPDCYWSSEQRAAGSAFAWGQYFDYGSQGDWGKDRKLRARAVRRLAIQ